MARSIRPKTLGNGVRGRGCFGRPSGRSSGDSRPTGRRNRSGSGPRRSSPFSSDASCSGARDYCWPCQYLQCRCCPRPRGVSAPPGPYRLLTYVYYRMMFARSGSNFGQTLQGGSNGEVGGFDRCSGHRQPLWVSRNRLPSPSISAATEICPDLSWYLVAVGPAYGFGPTSSAGLRAGRYRQSGSESREPSVPTDSPLASRLYSFLTSGSVRHLPWAFCQAE